MNQDQDVARGGVEQQAPNQVDSMLLPLTGVQLLIPNLCVAEIVSSAVLARREAPSEDWILGDLDWRGTKVPLIAFEVACGRSVLPIQGLVRHAAVLYSIARPDNLKYLAVLTQGLPRIARVQEDSIAVLPNAFESCPFVQAGVAVNNLQAVIPDLGALERAVVASA